MKKDASRPIATGRAAETRRSSGLVLLVLLLISCIGLLASALKFEKHIQEFRSANSDNQGWILSQLEVDYQALLLATLGAIERPVHMGQAIDPQALDHLNLRFDIFYSRVTVVHSAVTEFIPDPTIRAKVEMLIDTRAQMVGLMDRINATGRQGDGLADLRNLLVDQAMLVRRISTRALQSFIDNTNADRIAERNLWQRFMLESLVLLSMTGLAAVLADRLWRDLEKRTLQAERAAATLEKAYEASLSAVIVSDLDGRIVQCNRTAETMFGMDASQLRGQLLEDTIVPQDLRRVYRRKLDALRAAGASQTRAGQPYRAHASRRGGNDFPTEVSHVVDLDQEGNPILVTFLRDISRQVAAEQRLRAALEESKAATAAKSMFLATMSHEMRTPLHGIMAALDLLDQASLTPADQDLLGTARECSARALAQVNEVLNFTKMSESTERLSAFSPAEVARGVFDETRALAAENGNEMRLDLSGDSTAVTCIGQPAAYARALYNLMGNAVKFTRDGEVVLSLSINENADGTIRLTTMIRDTGPGIAPENHARIFEMFETLYATYGNRTGKGMGTGLGLPIARLAVESMGGTLKLDSALGAGARFSFTLDLPRDVSETGTTQAPTPQALRFLPHAEGRARDILIVDDNEVNLTLMREMVRRLGYRPHLARNGREAVDQAAAFGFEIILMDVTMPVMDGRDASLLIRQDGPSRHAFILGVTALIEAEDPDWYEDFGMDAVLVKPVSSAALARMLDDIEAGLQDDCAETLEPMENAVIAMSEETVFDFGALCALVGDETAPLLVQATLADARAVLAREVANDFQALAERAHRAAGSSAVVGFGALQDRLRQIEKAAKAGDDAALAQSLGLLAECIAQADDMAHAAQQV